MLAVRFQFDLENFSLFRVSLSQGQLGSGKTPEDMAEGLKLHLDL